MTYMRRELHFFNDHGGACAKRRNVRSATSVHRDATEQSIDVSKGTNKDDSSCNTAVHGGYFTGTKPCTLTTNPSMLHNLHHNVDEDYQPQQQLQAYASGGGTKQKRSGQTRAALGPLPAATPGPWRCSFASRGGSGR